MVNFDFEKLAAVAELGEVIRLQNEALERLTTFRRERPYLIVPNLAKMVEENLKENVHILYKEMNNMHKPPAQQKRHICRECSMGFAVALPGGICDECRANKAGGSPRVLPKLEEAPAEKASGGDDLNFEAMMAAAVLEESADTATAEAAVAPASEPEAAAEVQAIAGPDEPVADDAPAPAEEPDPAPAPAEEPVEEPAVEEPEQDEPVVEEPPTEEPERKDPPAE